MQTFLPYANFHLTAEVLDRKRLGKQRVEALQILKSLKKGKISCALCGKGESEWTSSNCTRPNTHKSRLTPWYNHPVVQMWQGYEAGLMLYLQEMCREWTRLGYQDTCWEKAQELGFHSEPTLLPDWIGNERFHLSHQSNLLRKDHDHYVQFFMGVSDDLPYVWPTKE